MKPNASTRHLWLAVLSVLAVLLTVMSSCMNKSESPSTGKATVAEAEDFIRNAEKRMLELNLKYSYAD